MMDQAICWDERSQFGPWHLDVRMREVVLEVKGTCASLPTALFVKARCHSCHKRKLAQRLK